MVDPRKNNPTTLIVGEVEAMPICGTTKPFLMMDQSVICTVETKDLSGAPRGAVAIGLSHSAMPSGFATYASIGEAEAIIVLIQNGIDDAKRIEAGQQPYAPEGIQPPVKH